MANVTAYVQSVQAIDASTSSADHTDLGSKDVKRVQDKQRQLNELLKKKKLELDQLTEKMKEISGKSGFSKFVGGLFGSDSGAGKTAEKTNQVAAEMKKMTEEVKIAESQIDMLLKELQATQEDEAQRLGDVQKTGEESAKAQKVANS
jgi:peptidoglycan hydrolase CwlO-like protein